MSATLDRDVFVTRTLEWLHRTRVPAGFTVDADTPLFASGLIDSLGILSLIAWTEHLTERRIADLQIRMDNFRTVRRIAEVFCEPSVNAGGSDVAA
jgi:acyl carrier protein